MLYTYPQLDLIERDVLKQIDGLRKDLRYFVSQHPKRWYGLLARMTRAKALRASNSIEDINVSAEDAIAAVDGEEPAEADRATWNAVLGYQEAMTYILQRSRDQDMSFSIDAILAIHFMITQNDIDANPGNFRRGWVGIRNTETNEVVHEGVDRDFLIPLVKELVEYLNDDAEIHIVVKAALAHLNLTLLHPFSDGNGRAARSLQTAVLANEGIVAQEFSSIEEYIGRNQQEYYDVLSDCGGGGWNPDRSCKPWIRFCLKGHYIQLKTLLRRNDELGKVYGDLLELVKEKGAFDRMAIGLLHAAFGSRVRNASYRVSADISNNLASRDLKLLVDLEFLESKGERRGRYYIASKEIQEIRNRHRTPKAIRDPFENEQEKTEQLAMTL